MPKLPTSPESRQKRRRIGYLLAIIGCIFGGVFGYVFREVALGITDRAPITIQDIQELESVLLHKIHPQFLVYGFIGITLIFVGCFLVVQAKELHMGWILAGMLSFIGILILAKLPDGNQPKSTSEAFAEIGTLIARFKRLFVFALVISVLVSAAWACL